MYAGAAFGAIKTRLPGEGKASGIKKQMTPKRMIILLEIIMAIFLPVEVDFVEIMRFPFNMFVRFVMQLPLLFVMVFHVVSRVKYAVKE